MVLMMPFTSNLRSFDFGTPPAEACDLCRRGRSKLHFLPMMQTDVAGHTLKPVRFVHAIGPKPRQHLRRKNRFLASRTLFGVMNFRTRNLGSHLSTSRW